MEMTDSPGNHQKRKYSENTSEISTNKSNKMTDLQSNDVKKVKTEKLRRSYSFDEKLQVLKKLDSQSIASVCDELGINERTLRKWKHQRLEIEKICSNDNTKYLKKNRTSNNLELGDPLMYCKIEMTDISENSQKRKETDNSFAEEFNDINFSNSTDILEIVKNEKSRKSYSFHEKLQVLQRIDSEPVLKVCEELQINQRTIRKWKKQRSEIEANCNNETTKYLKKNRTPHNPKLDDTLEAWIVKAKDDGVFVSGSIVQSKARSLNVELGGKSDFKASSGWLTRWKQRKGYRSLKELGENSSQSSESVEN